MKAPRTYTARNSNVPEPSAADLAAGIVGLMDIPVHTPIPLLRLKTCQFRKEKARLTAYRNLLKREGRKPYVCTPMRRLKKVWRLRSSHGLPVMSFREKAQTLSKSLNEEFHVMQNQSSVCLCLSCQQLRRWSSTLQPYRCTNTNCRISFASCTDLYEHQLDVHGGLDPRANRIVNELYHQQQGMLAFPPSTVYAGQQFLTPSRPPTPWKSMDELDEEARTLLERLRERNQDLFVRPFNVFKTAYELVKRNGWKEMERQYHTAMEHYFAAMKYPASSRGFHDGCPSVERGRNWLTSTDREDARLLHPFSLGDKVSVEPEFVLIDTNHDQEMCTELSGDEDDEEASVDGNSASEQKIVKVDEDVEMKDAEGDRIKSARERTAYKVDSDNDIELKSCESSDGKSTKRKVLDVDSGIDEDSRVKSEDSGSDSDAQLSEDDDNVELRISKLSDSESENDEDGITSKEQESGGDKSVSNVQLSFSEDSSEQDAALKSETKVEIRFVTNSEEPKAFSHDDIFNQLE